MVDGGQAVEVRASGGRARAQKARAVFQLLRIPNVFTAMADVLAGYLIVALHVFSVKPLLGVLAATACIYSLGCVLNDLMDRETDRMERPSRPIPSQAVTIAEAVVITFILAALGFLSAWAAGFHALVTACLLIVLVVVYDVFSKQDAFWGPLGMAGCRALNLVLGMSPHPAGIGIYGVLPLLTLGYVFGLTVLSRLETGRKEKGYAALLAIGWGLFGTGVIVLLGTKLVKPIALVYLAVLLGVAGPFVVTALKSLRPQAVQRAVKWLVLGIAAVDAFYVSGVHGFSYGLPVMACLLPSVYLARKFYVT